MFRLSTFLFEKMFDGLALGGAVATWGLVWWLIAPFGPPVSLPVHAAFVGALVALNWPASRALAGKPAPPLVHGRLARVLLSVAFSGIAGSIALGAAAILWLGAAMLGTLQAEAGTAAAGFGPALFGPAFRPFATSLIGLTLGTVAYGYTIGARRRVVTQLTVPMAGLPCDTDGLRIVHVSDLHLGPFADRKRLRAALAEIAALDPDVVCVTGDIVDSPATDLAMWCPELAALTARHGVYAILGNHDRQVGADTVAAALARWTSWRVLRNEVATVDIDGVTLHLLGLEDRRRPFAAHLPRLLSAVPEGAPAVLLCHKPDVFYAAARAQVPLTLAGHTHGGQVAVPGVSKLNVARLLLTRLDGGSFRHGNAILHVSRGLGMSGQPVRVGVPAEITLLRLVSRAAAAA